MRRDPISDKKVRDIYHSVGLVNNLRDEQVLEIINSQYKFVYDTIRAMNLEGLTPEEIDNQKRTFVFKYLGKLYTDSEVIRKHKIKDQIVKERQEDARAKEFEQGRSDGNQ